jgi:Papain-like cysteine protease AvrRpt2
MADAADIAYAPQPQQASLLCWAATTQIVADVLNHPVGQATVAVYGWVPPGTSPQAQAFVDKLQKCNQNIAQFCNTVYSPVLHELGFSYLKSSALAQPFLTENLITADIDAGRPIIFGWQFDNSGRNGVHFMVIVGYYRTQTTRKLKLHIYDPLPVTVGNAQTISFDNYTVTTPIDLHIDMGLPYAVAESYYNIRAIPATAPTVPMPPTGLTVSGPAGGTPAPKLARVLRERQFMDPRLAIEASRSAAQTEVTRRESEDRIKLSLGFPLPIIALGLEDLRAPDAPSLIALLGRDSGAVLYPVLSGERVRDSFLMIKRGDEWVAGGYANTSVARRLVEQRRQRASTVAENAQHYLLSVPALGGFFLARGTGADATLIPVNDDPSIKVGERPLHANTPYRADEVLPALAEAARNSHPSQYSERSLR